MNHTQTLFKHLLTSSPFVSFHDICLLLLSSSHAMSPALLADGASAAKGIDYFESCLKQILSNVQKSSLEPPLAEPSFDTELLARIKPATLPVNELYKTSLETACKGILYELAVSMLLVIFFNCNC